MIVTEIRYDECGAAYHLDSSHGLLKYMDKMGLINLTKSNDSSWILLPEASDSAKMWFKECAFLSFNDEFTCDKFVQRFLPILKDRDVCSLPIQTKKQ